MRGRDEGSGCRGGAGRLLRARERELLGPGWLPGWPGFNKLVQ